jgi:hypothetical protein
VHSLQGSCACLHFCRNENKCYLSETSVNALLVDTLTALLAGILGSDRETIETHSLSLSDFNSTMKSYTQHIKQMYNRKANIHEHNINAQRTTPNHEFESTLSINSNAYTWVFLHNSLYALLLNAQDSIMLKCTMRVSISRFPLALYNCLF